MAANILHPMSDIGAANAKRKTDEIQIDTIEGPRARGSFELDRVIIDGTLPIERPKSVQAFHFGEPTSAMTAKIEAQLRDGTTQHFFLKVIPRCDMCEGEYESLRAIHDFYPEFVPKPITWGSYKKDKAELYFLLEEFREISKQPAEPVKLATRLADLHHRSHSPTGKFGFHAKTCHGPIAQNIDQWDDSWAALFSRHLGHFLELVKPIVNCAQFSSLGELVVRKVVPRLLLPLQSGDRTIKPALVHGDCWDGNTALDTTGDAIIFDACSFYGHNEYDIGNWRAPRHKLSNQVYVDTYKRNFPVSKPAEDWDARNLLYSLPFNIGNIINIPGSQQRQVVFEDMKSLCEKFCRGDLAVANGENLTMFIHAETQ